MATDARQTELAGRPPDWRNFGYPGWVGEGRSGRAGSAECVRGLGGDMRNRAARARVRAGVPVVVGLVIGSVLLAGCSLLPRRRPCFRTDRRGRLRRRPLPRPRTRRARPPRRTGRSPRRSRSATSPARLPSPTHDGEGRGERACRSPGPESVAGPRVRPGTSQIPVFSGPAVAAEANRRVRAAANDLIAQVRREAKGDRGVKRTLTGTGTVAANDGRTVQVTIMFTDFLAGHSPPSLYVTTTPVVDVAQRSAGPVDPGHPEPRPKGLRFLPAPRWSRRRRRRAKRWTPLGCRRESRTGPTGSPRPPD